MSGQAEIRAEEIVRALAVAAAAVRLYPPTSEIPAQTVDRVISVSEAVTTAARSPVRFAIEPKGFKLGDQLFGEGQAQVVGLAEALYAHQIGQLIVAPGVTAEETSAFLRCVGSDPSAVREEGGLRHVMVTAGVAHIAVVELTLRASNEEGLAGLDLTSAPLEVVGPAVLRSAADWARSAGTSWPRSSAVSSPPHASWPWSALHRRFCNSTNRPAGPCSPLRCDRTPQDRPWRGCWRSSPT
jgi:hypothetical protein